MYLYIFVSVSYQESLSLAFKSFRRMHSGILRNDLIANDNEFYTIR